MIEVAYTNESTILKDAEILNALPAFQAAVTEDVSPIWGPDAKLTFYPKGTAPPPMAWRQVAADTSDQVGAMGYHLMQSGIPFGFFFVKSDIAAGLSWQVTAFHELVEQLIDAFVFAVTMIDGRQGFRGTSGVALPIEPGDAVESDTYAYTRPGADGTPIKISNFTLPPWHGAQAPPNGYPRAKGVYDFMGVCTAPFQLMPGGYIGTRAYSAGQWGQTTGRNDPGAANMNIYKADGTIMQAHEIPAFSRRDRRNRLMAANKDRVFASNSLLGGVHAVSAVEAASALDSMPTEFGNVSGAADAVNGLVTALTPILPGLASDLAAIAKHLRNGSDEVASLGLMGALSAAIKSKFPPATP